MRLRSFATTAALVTVAIAILASACGGGSAAVTPTPSASSTAMATPETPTPAPPTATQPLATQPLATTITPTPEPQSAAGFKAALDTLNTELAANTVDPLIARLKVSDYTCAAADLNGAPGRPSCASAGQVVRVVSTSQWRSESGLHTVEDIVTNLQSYQVGFVPTQQDKFGPGTFRVYAFDATTHRAVLTVTARCLRDYPCTGGFMRLVWAPTFEYIDGSWKISELMYAFILGSEFLDRSAEVRQLMPGWQVYR